MKQRSITLTIAGVLLFLLAIFHILFRQIFAWDETLDPINTTNWGIMYALNIVAIICFAAMAAVTLFFQQELVTTRLGKSLLVWFVILWIVRFALQFILWEFTFSIGTTILALVFLYLAVVYLLALVKRAA
jgi:hypothetical protein